MNIHAPKARGRHLVKADRGIATTGGLARLLAYAPARLFARALDRIDDGLAQGSLEAHLPDGTIRLLGGRGAGPHAVVHLHSWAALVRLGLSGSVGWYSAWARGEWNSPDAVPLFDLFMRNGRSLGQVARARGPWRWLMRAMHALRRNDHAGSRRNILAHYDLGNDFYAAWLDAHMVYSSAMFDSAGDDLETGQLRKIDAILDRLKLHSGSRLLEIGCGWGALGFRAIARHDALYHGITLSHEQAAVVKAGLAKVAPGGNSAVEIVDYRAAKGHYDAIASVEMVEAVGQDYWPDYIDALHRLLRPGGRAAIQYIAIDDAVFDAYSASADFIQTYIFPGGCLISESRFRALAEARGFTWQDERRFGQDYAETLRRWRVRFDAAIVERRLPQGFDAQFIDLWRFYLMYCEGGFRSGGIWVSQVTLEKVGE